MALLDAARTANAMGAYDDALDLVESYRRRFPAGALSTDAEVVRIESLAARGDSAAARRAAERFLARHPEDPHAARVRRFAHVE